MTNKQKLGIMLTSIGIALAGTSVYFARKYAIKGVEVEVQPESIEEVLIADNDTQE